MEAGGMNPLRKKSVRLTGYLEWLIRREVGGVEILTPELIAASLVFGKDQLDSIHQDFTSLTEPRVYHYHLQGWNIEDIP